LIDTFDSEMNTMTDTALIVQRLWNFCNVLKDDGVSYSDYVEQLTFLLFLKMEAEASGKAKSASRIPEAYRWPSLVNRSGLDLETHYFATLQALSQEPGIVGRIFHRAQNRIQDAAKLKRLVALINAEKWSMMDADVKGAIYEGLLEKNAEDVKSGAGQYFTPRSLLRAIVEVVAPKPDDTMCDPACGTGGFFLAVHRYVTSQRKLTTAQARHVSEDMFSGHEIVPTTARLCLMNLVLQGIGGNRVPISVGDALIDKPDTTYDLVLTNPPFGRKSSMIFTHEDGKEDRENLIYQRDDFVATTSNKQLNFLQHIMTLLNKRGRAAVVVPDNVLFEGGAGEAIRRHLLTAFEVHTLLRLPPGIFYAPSVKANVLFFERHSRRRKIHSKDLWVYDLRSGSTFSLRSKPMGDGALRDFVNCFKSSSRATRTESERFKRFDVADLLKRDRCSLDLGLSDPGDGEEEVLPPPAILAAEIIDKLEAAADAIRVVEEQLGR
jgi:type I restriction enzyme M protein